MANKMTNREFLTEVINGNLAPEIVAFASEQIAKLDEKNAMRKAKPSKARLENLELLEQVIEIIGDKIVLAKDIAEELNVTVSKAGAVLRLGVEEGKIVQIEGKKSDPYSYTVQK